MVLAYNTQDCSPTGIGLQLGVGIVTPDRDLPFQQAIVVLDRETGEPKWAAEGLDESVAVDSIGPDGSTYIGNSPLRCVAMLVQIGLHLAMVETLKGNGVESVIYDGVEPDPTFQHVEEGLAILRQHQCDAVLAIGGGSPIDTAKMISARATNDQPITKMAFF